MFIDAQQLAPESEIDADVCIVGSGPAGIAVAREFLGSSTRVVLLESGGMDPETPPQDFSRPARLSFGNVPAITCNRQFGGNASVWTVQTGKTWLGVRLMPLPEADFVPRKHMAESGWPISRADLDPYYARAQEVFQVGPNAYEAADWTTADMPAMPLPADRVRTRMFQFGDGHVFLKHYREQFARSANVSVYYHATAVELEASEDGAHISSVRAMSAPGRAFRVRAKQVVLAAGGFATPQLLLHSDARHPGGIGNQGGVLGRYMMDHPYLHGGELIPFDRQLFERTALYDLRWDRGVPVMGHLQIADEQLVNQPLLGLYMILFPRERNYEAHRSLSPRQQRSFDALMAMRRDMLNGRPFDRARLTEVITGVDGIMKRALDRVVYPKALIGRGGWSALSMKARRFHSYEVVHLAEQPPRHDNRIYLSPERDALGVRRLVIDWRWHAEDIAAIRRSQEFFAAELRRAGIGEFRITDEGGAPKVLSHSTAHYMGTTRMHQDPSRGVVDANCKVHGVDNLYLASASVFPTGGFGNPTLTIVAMALLVADRVRAAGMQGAPSLAPAPALQPVA